MPDPHGNNDGPVAPASVEQVVLTIHFNPATGRVNVTGPLDNQLLAYGLLEMARTVVAERAARSVRAGGIVLPPRLLG